MRNEFVSGLPGPPERQPTLTEALKKLEANVKGYGRPATAESKALTARMTGDREDPNAGWHPVMSKDEMVTYRLERVPLVDTTNAEQLPLFAQAAE